MSGRSGVDDTCNVTEESLVRTWCKQGYPVVLTSCLTKVSMSRSLTVHGNYYCWYSTCKLTDADEDREVTKPDEYETVDKASRPATIEVSEPLVIWADSTHFWNPVKKMLCECQRRRVRSGVYLTQGDFPMCTSNHRKDPSWTPGRSDAVDISLERNLDYMMTYLQNLLLAHSRELISVTVEVCTFHL